MSRPVGYMKLHKRVWRARGRAAGYPCTQADGTCKGRMEWACISREYRDIDDFMVLCISHHRRYDSSPETRAALVAGWTPEKRAKQAAWWTPERRAEKTQNQIGVPHSPERRAAESRGHRGYKASPEVRAAQSLRQTGIKKGPYSAQARANNSAAQLAYQARKRAERDTGC